MRKNRGLKVKGRGHWEWICKNQFRSYPRPKWIDLRHSKIKTIIGIFYTNCRLQLTSGNASFCDICLSVCLSVCHISDIPIRLLNIGT